MVKFSLHGDKPLPKTVWFILLYLLGLGCLTVIATLLKLFMSYL